MKKEAWGSFLGYTFVILVYYIFADNSDSYKVSP